MNPPIIAPPGASDNFGLGLPKQDLELVRRLNIRYLRGADPHNKWAKIGKRCVDFVEGRHYTPEQRAMLESVGRPALTINKIAPLYRLVMGYQSSNRMDQTFLPTGDGQSAEETAKLITAINKSEDDRMGTQYVDSDVFSDGIITGRGWWDLRLCFEKNDLGENKLTSRDPFSIIVDPDCNTYDINESAAYVQETRWTSNEEIGHVYGAEAEDAVENLLSPTYHSEMLHYFGEQEISPLRFFGQYEDDKNFTWNDVYHMDFVDRQAKRIRLLDTQYYIRSVKPCFMDLNTGAVEPIPDEWLKPENHHRIQKCIDYAAQRGEHVTVVKRPVRRVRWTVTCGDVILHDNWSPYEAYTLIGFFPYFRRGATRGMVEDMIDPQIEQNKKRSILTDILNRNANGGWIYEEGTLDGDQEENLRRYGSSPGILVKWKRAAGGQAERPARIEPGGYPQGLDRLEEKNANDLYQISGINESALGQLDRVQSGRAIEARQRQAVLAIQMYQDNFSRSKQIQGQRKLEMYQNHYTEERMFRIAGSDSSSVLTSINVKQATGQGTFERINDITVGRYAVKVDEVPMSASYQQAQFEEAIEILTKLGPVGEMLAQTAPHLIVEMSSLPRKQEWKQALMGAVSQVAMQQQAPMMGVPGQPGQNPQMAAMPGQEVATTPEGYAS